MSKEETLVAEKARIDARGWTARRQDEEERMRQRKHCMAFQDQRRCIDWCWFTEMLCTWTDDSSSRHAGGWLLSYIHTEMMH